MAVDEPDKIDAIGVDNETGCLVLTISDHLPWVGLAEDHRELLRDKLNTYLAFVESGELFEAYPSAEGRDVVISVIGRFDLSSVGTEFFANANETTRNVGICLEFKKFVG
jgi:hypothetical protein